MAPDPAGAPLVRPALARAVVPARAPRRGRTEPQARRTGRPVLRLIQARTVPVPEDRAARRAGPAVQAGAVPMGVVVPAAEVVQMAAARMVVAPAAMARVAAVAEVATEGRPVDRREVPLADSVEVSVADSAKVDQLAARAAGSAAATVAAMAATDISLPRRGGRAAEATPTWRDGRSRQARRRRRHPGPPAGGRRRAPDAGFPCCIFASRIRL